jgi:hypothetical protein
MPSLHFAVAPVGSLSSAFPDPPVALVLDAGAAVLTRSVGGAGAGAAGGLTGAVLRAAGGVGAGAGAGVAAGAAAAEDAEAIPPCLEHAPRPAFDIEPSVQVTELLPLAAVFAAAVAFLSTPPCPEQAPRPEVLEVVPSVHTLAADACAVAEVDRAQKAASAVEESSKRRCIGGLRVRERATTRRNCRWVQTLAIRIILPRQGWPDTPVEKSLC